MILPALICPLLVAVLAALAVSARIGNAYARIAAAMRDATRRAFGAQATLTNVRLGARATVPIGDASLRFDARVRSAFSARLPGVLPCMRAAVDAQGARRRFAVERVTLARTLAAAVGATDDVGTGDRAFDAAWIVHGDRALARAVLDADARARLAALQTHSDRARPGMPVTLELGRDGLELRWWGAPDAAALDLAGHLLLGLRARLLEYLAREALAQAGTGAFRGGTRVELDDGARGAAAEPAEARRTGAPPDERAKR